MRRLFPAAVAVSLLLLPGAALAQRKPPPAAGGNPSQGATYIFFVGGDLLGGFDPTLDPVIMAADNGDRLEIRGEGDFQIWPKDIFGGGTFVHKDATGNEIRRGSWIAVEFLSFNSYDGLGGQLQLRIDLIPAGQTAGIPGKMQVDCPLGDPPPSAVFEARVVFQDSGLNFNRRIQGGTLFFKLHIDPPICGGIRGNCAHSLCSVGGPLSPTCQPEIDPTCVARICEVDPYCCSAGWHQGCVDAVKTVCGLCCCTKGIAPCD
ncbi:MAG TPA: hypothetical protein VGV60_14535 [Candidatus Polarisedimenticolia bacterium]|jgi:hypothetical protein|nr:hypothetical protein [Candidatus Polarisedimenticolia bacterium]